MPADVLEEGAVTALLDPAAAASLWIAKDRPMTIKLSVVVITKNEEVDLPGFISNFENFADEIVIIDDGSTDRTPEIAALAGDKVRFISDPRQPEEGFCHQRQKGVLAAKGDWLLQVDCDMRLSPELAAEILSAIEDPKMAAYRFRLRQYFMNKPVQYGGFQYWNQLWLSRRELTSWTQKVHERIHVDAPPERIGQLRNKMHHLIDIDFSERLRKNYQYSHFEAERLLSQGKKIGLLNIIFFPLWRGFRSYVPMLGFLDGKVGAIWALYQVSSNMTPLYLAWAAQHGGSRAEIEQEIRTSMASLKAPG